MGASKVLVYQFKNQVLSLKGKKIQFKNFELNLATIQFLYNFMYIPVRACTRSLVQFYIAIISKYWTRLLGHK